MDGTIILIISVLMFIIVGLILTYVIEGRRDKKFEKDIKKQGFNVTKKFAFGNGVLLIDEENRKWTVNNLRNRYKIYNFDNIIDAETFEDNANMGEVSSLGVKITVNDLANPLIQLNFLNTPTKRDSLIYKGYMQTANRIATALCIIKNQ